MIASPGSNTSSTLVLSASFPAPSLVMGFQKTFISRIVPIEGIKEEPDNSRVGIGIDSVSVHGSFVERPKEAAEGQRDEDLEEVHLSAGLITHKLRLSPVCEAEEEEDTETDLGDVVTVKGRLVVVVVVVVLVGHAFHAAGFDDEGAE
jgi:hypothetical protein